MAKVISQMTIQLPRLIEAGEYRKLRFAGRHPSLKQLKRWIEDGTVIGEIKGGLYFVDLQAELLGSNDPLLQQMTKVA